VVCGGSGKGDVEFHPDEVKFNSDSESPAHGLKPYAGEVVIGRF
jgi:hypothetical protein